MNIAKTLKMLMLEKEVKQLDVATQFGMSKNTFNNLLQRNNFKVNDIIKIADILGYDTRLQFVDRESKKVTDVELNVDTITTNNDDTQAIEPPTPQPQQQRQSFEEYLKTLPDSVVQSRSRLDLFTQFRDSQDMS